MSIRLIILKPTTFVPPSLGLQFVGRCGGDEAQLHWAEELEAFFET